MSVHQETANNVYSTDLPWYTILSNNIGNKDLIARGSTALELMGMFTGYLSQAPIEVYSKTEELDSIFDYKVVPCFNNIEQQEIYGISCTTFNQTINDMLDEFDTTDESALAEALAKHYIQHGNFNSITINPKHESIFQNMKDWAMEYYMEG